MDGVTRMSRLHLKKTVVQDCVVIEHPIFEDMRGVFMESFNRKDFLELGLPTEWPQDNQSGSKCDVVRGMHIQRRNPQGKLVRCVLGAVVDFCLDLRKDSPTFLRYHSEYLTGGKSMYCPPGTAHGFLALATENIIYYKCTTLYDKETDGGVSFYSFGYKLLTDPIIMSEKDMKMPTMTDWLKDPRGTWNE